MGLANCCDDEASAFLRRKNYRGGKASVALKQGRIFFFNSVAKARSCGKCFGSGEGETVYVCVAKPIKTVAVAAAMTTPTPAVKRLLAEEVM